MAAIYKQFLVSPNSSLLADRASLHYVTTTTTFTGPTEIIKHLNSLQKQVKKKKEDLLSVIEGHAAIAVEVDTALEFQTSGGVYLPGLDDNFLSDRIAYLPIVRLRFRPETIPRPSTANPFFAPDSHRDFRRPGQDRPDSPAMGPGLSPEAA